MYRLRLAGAESDAGESRGKDSDEGSAEESRQSFRVWSHQEAEADGEVDGGNDEQPEGENAVEIEGEGGGGGDEK